MVRRFHWCGRRDSNPHTLRYQNLNLARLPVPPRPHEPSQARLYNALGRKGKGDAGKAFQRLSSNAACGSDDDRKVIDSRAPLFPRQDKGIFADSKLLVRRHLEGTITERL